MLPSESDYRRFSFGAKPYKKIHEIANRPGSILVIPVGSVEQHGHHLPFATDSLLVSAVTNAAVDRVADDLPILVTPTIWTGHSPHHRGFGGTLSIPFDTMKQMVIDLADSALDNDFDSILLVNGHGGNKALISAVLGEIGREHPNVETAGFTYFELAADAIGELRESTQSGMAHAGEYETSLLMYLLDEFVIESEFEDTYYVDNYEHVGVDLLDGGPMSVYRSFTQYSDSGAVGDSTLASADKGERIFELVTDEYEAILRSLHEHTAD